jgi:hypothetical protein
VSQTSGSAALDVGERPSNGKLQTEFDFELPLGFADSEGELHRTGRMRLATARDEILPLRDPRVRSNEAYLTVVILARVVVQLGALPEVNPAVIEGLFAPDLAFLQDLYRRVNREAHTNVAVACPACQTEFSVDMAGGLPGES